MFYRKQNYLLILISICSILFFFFPFAEFDYRPELPCGIGVLGFSGFSFSSSEWVFWILKIFASALAGLSIVALTQFKKRMVQLRLTIIAFFVNILLVGLCFVSVEIITNKLLFTGAIEYTLAAYIPIISLLLLIIIQRAIRKDEAIARSLDRLR